MASLCLDMPPDRSIKDFFKPFTVPKHKRYVEEVIYDNIVVSSTKSVRGATEDTKWKPSTTVSPFRERHLDFNKREKPNGARDSTPTPGSKAAPKASRRPAQRNTNRHADVPREPYQDRGLNKRPAAIEKGESAGEDKNRMFDCTISGTRGENLDEGTYCLACEKCQVWQHTRCNGYEREEVEQEDFHFLCSKCKANDERETPEGTTKPLPALDCTADPDVPLSQTSTLTSLASHTPTPRQDNMEKTRQVAESAQLPKTAATSFSSVSTVSTIPGSQTSSKRVVKNGVVIITNSDSESQDSDGLADLDELIRSPKRPRLAPPVADEMGDSDVPKTARKTRQSARSSARHDPPTWKPISPPKTVYKHSLAEIVKQNKKRAAAEARIAEVETSIKAANEAKEVAIQQQGGRHSGRKIDGGAITANAGEEEDAGRLTEALQRTEALESDDVFHFFAGPDTFQAERTKFPIQILDSFWSNLLQDEATRSQACLSGFVAEVAAVHDPPKEVLQWLVNEVIFEPRDELCEAYIEILRSSCARAVSNLTFLGPRDGARPFFERVLGSERMLTCQRIRAHLPSAALRRILEVIYQCDWNDKGTNVSSVLELLLLNVDESVQRDAELQSLVHEALGASIDAVPEQNWPAVLADIAKNLIGLGTTTSSGPGISPLIGCRLVTSAPAYTPRLHELRRHMAMSWFLGSEEHSKVPLNQLSDLVLSRLKQSPDFTISEDSDYTLLAARIGVLDVAISGGFSDFAFLPSETQVDAVPTSKAKPFAKPHASSAGETAFNAQLDVITSQLRLLSSRIRDAGTSHLRRTEAKGAIERLIVRLDNCVRTRPKPKKSVFGGLSNDTIGFMERFVKKIDESAMEDMVEGAENDSDNLSDEVEVIPPEMLSDRDGPSGTGSEVSMS